MQPEDVSTIAWHFSIFFLSNWQKTSKLLQLFSNIWTADMMYRFSFLFQLSSIVVSTSINEPVVALGGPEWCDLAIRIVVKDECATESLSLSINVCIVNRLYQFKRYLHNFYHIVVRQWSIVKVYTMSFGQPEFRNTLAAFHLLGHFAWKQENVHCFGNMFLETGIIMLQRMKMYLYILQL